MPGAVPADGTFLSMVDKTYDRNYMEKVGAQPDQLDMRYDGREFESVAAFMRAYISMLDGLKVARMPKGTDENQLRRQMAEYVHGLLAREVDEQDILIFKHDAIRPANLLDEIETPGYQTARAYAKKEGSFSPHAVVAEHIDLDAGVLRKDAFLVVARPDKPTEDIVGYDTADPEAILRLLRGGYIDSYVVVPLFNVENVPSAVEPSPSDPPLAQVALGSTAVAPLVGARV